MKKIIFLLLCILFFTGCDVTYNINLDSFDENTVVVCDNLVSTSIVTDGMTESELYEYYLKKEVPYYYDQMVFSETNVKFEGVSYYDVSDLKHVGQTGLVFDAHFKNYSNYAKSRLLWNATAEKNIMESDNILKLQARKFILFDSYENVNNLTINITSKYRVISSNADKVKGNVYSWIIDRDNYKNKMVSISFNTGNVLDDAASEVKDDSMIKFTIVLCIIVTICFIIYFVVKNIFVRRNRI